MLLVLHPHELSLQATTLVTCILWGVVRFRVPGAWLKTWFRSLCLDVELHWPRPKHGQQLDFLLAPIPHELSLQATTAGTCILWGDRKSGVHGARLKTGVRSLCRDGEVH